MRLRVLPLTSAGAERHVERLLKRRPLPTDRRARLVARILERVRRDGDAAVAGFTKEFDGVALAPADFRVPPGALARALRRIDPAILSSLRLAARRIARYHRHAMPRPVAPQREPGVFLKERVRPLERVGIYVPGGRASYPSTLLMTAIPARVAGVREIIVCTPPGPEGTVSDALLAAAAVAGVRHIYRVGGAQAIAAMAFGTAMIPAVDKIVGPGNIYVALAKRSLYGLVGIDSVAGPSEVLVIADGTARPSWVAADLLAQAEHDPLAAAVLVTTSAPLARAVAREVAARLRTLPRAAVAAQALRRYGAAFIAPSPAACVALANRLAFEHVGLAVARPTAWAAKIRHAGALCLGHTTPEAFGDYLAGPNHTLPTQGTARFTSPLGVGDFLVRSHIIRVSGRRLARFRPHIARLAHLEGLPAHAEAIDARAAPRRRGTP